MLEKLPNTGCSDVVSETEISKTGNQVQGHLRGLSYENIDRNAPLAYREQATDTTLAS